MHGTQPVDFARNRLAAELRAAQDSLSRSTKRHDLLRRKVSSSLPPPLPSSDCTSVRLLLTPSLPGRNHDGAMARTRPPLRSVGLMGGGGMRRPLLRQRASRHGHLM